MMNNAQQKKDIKQSAMRRFKNSLQEDSKIHVIAEDVIESCHNGVVGWEKESMIQPILIRGQDDYIKTIERWNILKEFFSEKGIQYYEIKSESGNILSKIVNLIYLLDYASIYHAILHKIDPSPVDSIDFIKSRLWIFTDQSYVKFYIQIENGLKWRLQ